MDYSLDNQAKLLELIKKEKLNLNNILYEYLLSLVNLDVSAACDDISIDERRELDRLYIYRKIIFFNLYYREIELVKRLFKKNLNIVEIGSYDEFNIGILDVLYSKKMYLNDLNLFKLYYDNKNVPTVLLENLTYDRDADLIRLNKEIKKLTVDAQNNKRRLEQLNEMRRKLISHGISDCQRDKMNIINKHLNGIKEDFGLDDNVFFEKPLIIKKMPGLIVKQQIKKY